MSTDYPQNLATKLKHIRVVELDYSETEMADALGVTAAEVSEFENGRRELPLPLVLKYARTVGLSTDILLDDERKIRPNTRKS